MRKIIFIYGLLSGLCLQSGLYGQSVEIVGTVKSQQGAIQGAQVEFYLNNDFQGNCISSPNGSFKSEKRMAVGKTILIKISSTGYKTSEKAYTIDATGDAGEFKLESKSLVLTGFVRDSITQTALQGVEIFFYDDQGKLIQARSTNSMGYFDLETDFIYGQRITVRVAKKGYYDDKIQTLVFASSGLNELEDILLPELGARGLRAFIRVKDKRNGRPLGGGTVRYFDKKRSTYIDVPVPANGEAELKLYQSPGTTLDLQVIMPRYRTAEIKTTLSEEPLNNVLTCSLERGG